MRKIILFVCFLTCSLLLVSCSSQKGSYDTFTACLRNKQVVMFGASWCPHCAEQKKEFGKSVKQLPYFECAVSGGQAPECAQRQINSYPTWQFPDATIASLPSADLDTLFANELGKVEANTASLKKAVQEKKAELLPQVGAYEAKILALKNSTDMAYEKLKKLTLLTEWEGGVLVEQPVYLAGRLSGAKSLDMIALYSGCSAEYQGDLATLSQ